jgi:hypothetical protein
MMPGTIPAAAQLPQVISAAAFLAQFCEERVARHRRHEDGSGNGMCLKGADQQKTADLAGRGTGFRTEDGNQGPSDRKEDPPGTRRARWNPGRQHQVAGSQRVPQSQGLMPERTDKEKRDTFPEPRFGESAGEEECNEYEPHRCIAESAQCLFDFQGAGQRRCNHTGKDDSPHGKRPYNQTDNGGYKDSQEMPRFRFNTVWNGQKPYDNGDKNCNDETSQLKSIAIRRVRTHLALLSLRCSDRSRQIPGVRRPAFSRAGYLECIPS